MGKIFQCECVIYTVFVFEFVLYKVSKDRRFQSIVEKASSDSAGGDIWCQLSLR